MGFCGQHADSYTRRYHTATLLPGGTVLLAGGNGSSGPLSSAELYSPATKSWASTGDLKEARAFHSASLLPDGNVLVVGGAAGAALATGEVYGIRRRRHGRARAISRLRGKHIPRRCCPAARCWSPEVPTACPLRVPSSTMRRGSGGVPLPTWRHRATCIPPRFFRSGMVLVVGGTGEPPWAFPSSTTQQSASGRTPPASITVRLAHTATRLQNGKVLIVAGNILSLPGAATAQELYDPASNSWSDAGTLTTARQFHTATLLSDGGCSSSRQRRRLRISEGKAPAELYDPGTNAWSSTRNMVTGRSSHAAALLPNGEAVLVTGGVNGININTAEVYDPVSQFMVRGRPHELRSLGSYGNVAAFRKRVGGRRHGRFGFPEFRRSLHLGDQPMDQYESDGPLTRGPYGHSTDQRQGTRCRRVYVLLGLDGQPGAL